MVDDSEKFEDLDAFFSAARAETPRPSDALLERIAADAAGQTPRPEAARRSGPVRAVPARQGFLAALSAMLGGGGALAGLASAMLAGVWLGFAQPAPIAALTQDVTGQIGGQVASLEQVDLMPSIDSYLTGGGQ